MMCDCDCALIGELCQASEHYCRCLPYYHYLNQDNLDQDYHYCKAKIHRCICGLKCLSSNHNCICPNEYCKANQHRCLCVIDRKRKSINLINLEKCKSNQHECVCFSKFTELCKANNHICHCGENPYLKNFNNPCRKKNFTVNEHDCLCGKRPICFSKDHICSCEIVKHINLCIKGELTLKEITPFLKKCIGHEYTTSQNFIQFFRTNHAQFECGFKKSRKMMFTLCIRRTSIRKRYIQKNDTILEEIYYVHFPKELIDYIYDRFINCEWVPTIMDT